MQGTIGRIVSLSKGANRAGCVIDSGDNHGMEATAVRRSWLPALGASVLLHALVAAAFLFNFWSPVPPAQPSALPPALVVALTTSNPQRQPAPAPIPPESLLPEEESVTRQEQNAVPEPLLAGEESADLPEESIVAEPPQEAAAADAVPALTAGPGPEEVPLEAGQDAASPAVVAELPVPEPAFTSGLAPAQLETALATYMRSYRGSLTQGWVETCLKYQNRNGSSQLCPSEGEVLGAVNAKQKVFAAQLFETHVTRASDNARYSRRLDAESKYLETLLDEDSVLGAVAQQRYLMVRDYYCLLNGGEAGCKMTQSPTVMDNKCQMNGGNAGCASDFSAPTSETVALVSFGGGGLSVLNGLFTIDGKGQVRLLNFAPAVSAMPFTYFEPRPQAVSVAEEVGLERDEVEAFAVEVPLFPLR
jgi:hypothetical protein